jgi:tetratricopeptide (TPR) repeat protein
VGRSRTRWTVTVVAALSAFGICWWGVEEAIGSDAGVALGVAVVPFTIILTLGGVWADREKHYHPGPDVRETRPERVVVGDIPQEPAAFLDRTGRLTALLDSPPGRQGARVCAVIGLRGVGKSQLAAAYARRKLESGWQMVAWLDADGRDQLLAGFERLAAALGLSEDGQDSEESAARVRHWLEVDGSQCLLVLDNAADADLIRPFLPAAGKAHVIVTSSHQALTSLGVPVPIDVFTPQQAAGYLDERTGLADRSGAAKVADELGYLPLALAQAAAVIAGQRLDYGTYLRRLAAVPTAGYLARTQEDPYPRGTAEAIALSLDAVERNDPSGQCRQLLEVASLLSPAGVPRTLLALAAATSEESVDRCLQQLADASLLSWSIDGGSLTAHRLVTRVVRERSSQDDTLAAAVDHSISAMKTALPPSDQAWLHAANAQNLVQQITALVGHVASFPDLLSGQLGIELLDLRAWAASYLIQLKDSSRAVPVWEQIVADSERLLGPYEPHTLAFRSNLAFTYEEAGRVNEAITLSEQNLANQERILGPDHPDTLTSRRNLAFIYRVAGRLAEAIRILEQNVVDRDRVLGSDDPATLTSRRNLASAYREAGRFGDAIPLYEQIVADFKRVLGPDHPDTLASQSSLGYAYQTAGRVDDAIAMLEQNVTDRRRVLGAEHADTLTSRGNLAIAYLAAGRLNEAIAVNEQNLSDRTRILGADHPDTLTSRSSLGAAYLAAGRLNEAIAVNEQNLSDRTRILGADHPDTLTSRGNLALTYQAVGRLEDSISLNEQNSAEQQRILGSDHPLTLTSRGNLALAYQAVGRLDEAISLLEQNVADQERVLGPMHPDAVTSRGNLALAYQAAGRVNEAIPLLEQALATSERVLGPNHPTSRKLREHLRRARHLKRP